MALATALPPVSDPSPALERVTDAPRRPVDIRPGGDSSRAGRDLPRQRRPKLGPVGHPHRRHLPEPTVRLTRRGVVASWALGVLTVIIIAFGLVQGARPMAPAVVGTTSVTALPGQTLWGIAESVNPETDPRLTVQAIRDLNGIEPGSTLRSGATVAIPVFDSAR